MSGDAEAQAARSPIAARKNNPCREHRAQDPGEDHERCRKRRDSADLRADADRNGRRYRFGRERPHDGIARAERPRGEHPANGGRERTGDDRDADRRDRTADGGKVTIERDSESDGRGAEPIRDLARSMHVRFVGRSGGVQQGDDRDHAHEHGVRERKRTGRTVHAFAREVDAER